MITAARAARTRTGHEGAFRLSLPTVHVKGRQRDATAIASSGVHLGGARRADARVRGVVASEEFAAKFRCSLRAVVAQAREFVVETALQRRDVALQLRTSRDLRLCSRFDGVDDLLERFHLYEIVELLIFTSSEQLLHVHEFVLERRQLARVGGR